jgi:hypothetical protein
MGVIRIFNHRNCIRYLSNFRWEDSRSRETSKATLVAEMKADERKKERKKEMTKYIFQRHAPKDLLPPTRFHHLPIAN